ncbi:MAG: CPBP family intramembrane metalloprotease [Salibacteraceae bacterium]
MREALRNARPLVQLLVLVGIGFAGMFVMLSAVVIPFYLAGYDLVALSSAGSLAQANSAQIWMLKTMQIGQAIGLFITPYLVYRFVIREDVYTLNPYTIAMRSAGVFFLSILLAFPLINFLAEWNSGLNFPVESINQWMHDTEADAERLIKVFLQMDHIGDLLFNILLIALIPAVGEEMLFRGTVQPLMLKGLKNHHAAIWVTAFIFSFIHLQFLGFFPRFLLGALLGYAAHWTGSLWAPMMGHFANNALAVVVAYFIGVEALEAEAETFGSKTEQVVYTVLSCIALTAGMWVIYKRRISASYGLTPEQK